MRNLCTLLFLVAAISASAQFCRKDTVTSYNISTSNVKSPYYRTINYYKSTTNNQLDSSLIQKWDENSLGNAAWIDQSKKSYMYANGFKTQELASVWDFNLGGWQYDRKQNWDYNASGKILFVSDSSFASVTNNYVLGFKEVYTYDANNNQTEKVTYIPQSPIYKVSRTFNASNLITQVTTYQSTNGGTTFLANGQSIFDYNADNKIILEQIKNRNTSTDLLEFYTQTITEYNGNKQVSATEIQNYGNDNWNPSSRITYTYNSDSLVTIEGNPIYSGGQWTNYRQTVNSYNNKLLTQKSIQIWNIVSANTWTTINNIAYNYNTYKKVLVENYTVFANPVTGMVPQTRTTYAYIDSSEWTEKTNENYDNQSSKFIGTTKETRAFNSKGSKLIGSTLSWITQTNSWRPNYINHYTYSTSNNLTLEEQSIWDNGINQIRPNYKKMYEFDPTYDYQTAYDYLNNFNTTTSQFGTHTRDEYACVNSIVSTTGLKNIAKKSLKIYPNPNNTGLLTIENAIGSNLSIYNTMGQKVLGQSMEENNSSVDISAMPKGLYIVIMESNGAKQTSKLIVE